MSNELDWLKKTIKIKLMFRKDYYNKDFRMKKEKYKLDINLKSNKYKRSIKWELNNLKINWKECRIEVNYLIRNGWKN